MRRMRFHDRRPTRASLMAEAGAPPKYVQEQLGHLCVKLTVDTYSHLFPDGNRGWVRKLNESATEGWSENRSATQPRPEPVAVEKGDHKSLESLVAVEGFEPPARGL